MKSAVVSNLVPKAVGPYSSAVRSNGLIFVSGQLPIDAAVGAMPEGIEAQTRQSLLNIKALLTSAGCSMDDVLKTTVYLSDIANFGAMNEVYKTFFNAPFPARSAFAVKDLPMGALVEIECFAQAQE